MVTLSLLPSHFYDEQWGLFHIESISNNLHATAPDFVVFPPIPLKFNKFGGTQVISLKYTSYGYDIKNYN